MPGGGSEGMGAGEDLHLDITLIEKPQLWLYGESFTAKSLQSYPTLCDPIDGSPPGSSIPGILQARTLEWVAISFSNAWKWKVKVKSLSRVWLLATPWTTAYQAPPSMGFSRQEYWRGCHCLLWYSESFNHSFKNHRFDSRFVIGFSLKEQAFFNFMAAVTICSEFGTQEDKVCHCFHCFPIYLPWSDGTGCHNLFECTLNVLFKCTLLTKVHIVKATVFPVLMYGCESWIIKKAEPWGIDAYYWHLGLNNSLLWKLSCKL